MGHELRVTTDGLPQIEAGGVTYPLCFSALSFKRYAEHKGISYKEAVSSQWQTTDLAEEDVRKLLFLALEGGEMRRRVLEGGTARTIDAELVEEILAVYHPEEVGFALVQAWAGPEWVRALEQILARVRGEEPAEEDPQTTPAGTSPGPSSFEEPTG